MRTPHAVFAAPFFIEPIDLDKITMVSDDENTPFYSSFLSGVKTSMGEDTFTGDTYAYVKGLIKECIGQFLPDDFSIGQVWRNRYTEIDWQDPHIHSGAQWSFIIYETVKCSKTVFMNPSRKVIMNQWAMYGHVIPMDFMPQVTAGNILIFPSWIEHFVTTGNEGTTISGNIYLTEPPRGPS